MWVRSNMMNFLDLSAASEEERRLITELLTDTSVVNFPEPTRPQKLQESEQKQEQKSSDNQIPRSNYQQQNRQHSQHKPQPIKNNAAFTTTNVTQSSSTVPPQTLANHISPILTGDINNVIGMDMASVQPSGYPMPTPPPTHVTAYGPAPPQAPHHVYGGPPIFQPYATHYIIPYNLPYPMPYVIPPTNSVVPTRPQTSQSTIPMMSNNSRPHTHHPRSNKLKDMSKQQHHHHSHQNNHQPFQHQHEYRSNSGTEPHAEPANDVVDNSQIEYQDYNTKDQECDANITESTIKDSESAPDEKKQEPQLDTQHPNPHVDTQHVNVAADDAKVCVEEEIVKVSSDEGFDTQSSLDLSKQSHESNNFGERQKAKEAISNNVVSDNLDKALPSSNNGEESQSNQEVKSAASWGSSSSKSWASLFRANMVARNGAEVNGEIENENQRTLSSTNERDTKAHLQESTKNEVNGVSISNIASTKEQRSQDAARRAQDKLAPKLAQKINSISLKHSLPLLRPRGFINKGNGCYINSTLQALIACPPFYNLMKEIGELKGLKREGSCTPILDSFAELFQNFPPLDAYKKTKQAVASEQKLPMIYLQADAIEPRCIYNVLGQIKSECLRGAQEDAEEFLSSVLNGLHEEMIGLSETLQSPHGHTNRQNGVSSDHEENGDDINNDENLWREVGPKNRSLPIRTATVINTPVQEIFGGSLFSIRTAGKDRCGHRSPFFDLQLDISGDNVKTLQDAIKSFTATEIIQDFYCLKTKQKLDAQRRTSLDQLPPILILHLKQFFYTQDHGLKKLTKRIEYPIDFELPESCLHDKNSDKSLKKSRSYKLLAVVYHEGKEAVKGHYLTDVYHIGSSQWIRCDDSNLKVVPAPRIENPESSRTPYLLFYRRLNTLGPRQSSNHDNKKRS